MCMLSLCVSILFSVSFLPFYLLLSLAHQSYCVRHRTIQRCVLWVKMKRMKRACADSWRWWFFFYDKRQTSPQICSDALLLSLYSKQTVAFLMLLSTELAQNCRIRMTTKTRHGDMLKEPERATLPSVMRSENDLPRMKLRRCIVPRVFPVF